MIPWKAGYVATTLISSGKMRRDYICSLPAAVPRTGAEMQRCTHTFFSWPTSNKPCVLCSCSSSLSLNDDLLRQGNIMRSPCSHGGCSK